MLNLVNRILVLIIVVGVVGLVYLLALIVKLFRMKLDEGKTQAPHPQASYSKQSEATPGLSKSRKSQNGIRIPLR